MQIIHSDPFLPRVNVAPHSVVASAVARALRGIYAEMLEEPLPDEFAALLAGLHGPLRTQG